MYPSRRSSHNSSRAPFGPMTLDRHQPRIVEGVEPDEAAVPGEDVHDGNDGVAAAEQVHAAALDRGGEHRACLAQIRVLRGMNAFEDGSDALVVTRGRHGSSLGRREGEPRGAEKAGGVTEWRDVDAALSLRLRSRAPARSSFHRNPPRAPSSSPVRSLDFCALVCGVRRILLPACSAVYPGSSSSSSRSQPFTASRRDPSRAAREASSAVPKAARWWRSSSRVTSSRKGRIDSRPPRATPPPRVVLPDRRVSPRWFRRGWFAAC